MNKPTQYLKMQVLNAIEYADGKTIRERIMDVSRRCFRDNDNNAYQFTWRTIQTWYSRFKKHGVTITEPVTRSDKGKTRKVVPEDLLEAIEQVKPLVKDQAYNKALIYRLCIEKGLLQRNKVAPNTFSRLVNELQLLKPDSEHSSKRRQAFAKPFANDMWQGDTLVGPYVRNEKGTPIQTKLIAFIDDASRVVTHGEFFHYENTQTLIKAFRSAVYKRGLPKHIYVDNGSIYSSKEMMLLTARLGILLSHTPIRDGASKGKIERFFRTVRECFLARALDLTNLDTLNRQFIDWVESEYNSKIHSTLGMTPIDRFGLDRPRITYLPPNQANDEIFYLEDKRVVRADNTFNFKSVRYEAPVDLRNKNIQIRFDRSNPHQTVIVYYKDQRAGQALPLNPIANDRKPPAPTAA